MTRTRSVRRALLAGLATLSLGLAACGGDDAEGGDDTTASDDTTTEDTATEDTASEDTASGDTNVDDTAGSDADADAYARVAAEQLGMIDSELAECMGDALIDAIGIEEIQATGLSPEEFADAPNLGETGIEITDQLVDDMAAGFGACDGLEDELIESEFGDQPEVAACVAEILDDEIIADVFASTVLGAEPSEEALAAQAQTQECTPDTTPTT